MKASRLASAAREKVLGPFLSCFRTTNVAAFHIGRSGSNVLFDLLDQHSQIFWDGHSIYEILLNQLEMGAAAVVPRLGDPFAVLKPGMRAAGERIYGFDMKFYYLRFFGLTLRQYIHHLRECPG